MRVFHGLWPFWCLDPYKTCLDRQGSRWCFRLVVYDSSGPPLPAPQTRNQNRRLSHLTRLCVCVKRICSEPGHAKGASTLYALVCASGICLYFRRIRLSVRHTSPKHGHLRHKLQSAQGPFEEHFPRPRES